MKTPVIQVEDITKIYKMGEVDVHALRGGRLRLHPGTSIADEVT